MVSMSIPVQFAASSPGRVALRGFGNSSSNSDHFALHQLATSLVHCVMQAIVIGVVLRSSGDTTQRIFTRRGLTTTSTGYSGVAAAGITSDLSFVTERTSLRVSES